MANEMQIDLWICLPPNADDAYLTNIFRTFFYGSDGINPYTDVQANPIWAPLDPKRKLYFEVGNEVWNYSGPYGAITEQMTALAETEMAAGDPYNYGYAYPGYEPDQIQLMRMRLARLTAHASQLSRDVVGDENMMTRYRPVLAGQSAWSYPGLSSLSYLKTVLGGHDWYPNDWSEGRFPGRFHPAVLKGPEDGLSVNTFGNIAQPLSYWIYGYAIAPYVDGATVAELNVNLVSDRAEISSAIEISNQAGVKPLAYEGGIGNHVAVHDYEASGLDTVLEELLYHWYANGGGLFMNYTLAGNNGWGAFPDMTRQDPMNNLKLRALRKVAGLP
ncbi:MAG: hypothetical protein OEX19_08340 [Gammaproteobacteria bacterium]|nr:hypothetical protein [Gammaproteobacteria bacterium]